MQPAQVIENQSDLYPPSPFLASLLEEAERTEREEMEKNEVPRPSSITRPRRAQRIRLYSYD